jgi:hypothetical protein
VFSAPHAAKSIDKKKQDQTQESAGELWQRIARQEPGEVKKSVVPLLVQGLQHAATSQERQTYVRALGRLGPVARDAVPDLNLCLEKADGVQERCVVLEALGQMGPSAPEAMPVLVQCLKSDCSETRATAAAELVKFGPFARPVVARLAEGDAAGSQVARDVLARINKGHVGRVGVMDSCDLFKTATLRDSQREINWLAKTYHVEVFAETVPSLSAVAAKDASKLCDDRMREIGNDGIYILLCKEPRVVQVQVSGSLEKQGFGEQQRKDLTSVLETRLQNNDYDQAILAGLEFIGDVEKGRAEKNGKP